MYRPTAAHPPDAFRQRIRFAMASSLKRRRSTQSKRLIPFHRNRFHPTTIPPPQSSKQTLINETEGVRLDRLAAELGSFRFRLADRLIPDSEIDPTRYDACNQVPTARLEGGKPPGALIKNHQSSRTHVGLYTSSKSMTTPRQGQARPLRSARPRGSARAWHRAGWQGGHRSARSGRSSTLVGDKNGWLPYYT